MWISFSTRTGRYGAASETRGFARGNFRKNHRWSAVGAGLEPARLAARTLVHSMGDKETHAGVHVRKGVENRSPAYEKWSKNERKTYVRICGEPMRKLGYEVPI